MTTSLRIQLWTTLLQKRFAENPALVIDWLDAQNKQWTSYGTGNPYNDTYATPILYDALAGKDYDKKKPYYDAAILGVAAMEPGAGVAAGGAAIALDIYRKSVETDRLKLGNEIWSKDPQGVLDLARNYPAWQQAMGEIISLNLGPGGDRKFADAALLNLKYFEDVIQSAGIPSSSDSIEKIGALLGVDYQKLGFKQAYDDARAKAGVEADKETIEAEATSNLRKNPKIADTNELSLRFKEALEKQIEVEKAKEDELSLRRSLAEFRAYGQLLGIAFSIGHDPKKGALITALFDNSATLYSSYKALSAAGAVFSVATFASGVGAALAIYGILGSFGKKEESSSAIQTVLDAIRGLHDRIDALSRQINRLAEIIGAEFGNLNFTLTSNLDVVKLKLDVVLAKVADVTKAFEQANRDSVLDLIAQQRIAIKSAPSPESCSNAFLTYYLAGTAKSNNDDWTGANKQSHEIAAAIFAETDICSLEQYPALMSRLHQFLTDRKAEKQYTNDPFLIGIEIEKLALSYGLPNELIADVQNSRSVSPRLTAIATNAYVDCFRQTYMRPSLRLKKDALQEFTFANRLTFLELLLQWPQRFTFLLGTSEALQFVLQIYIDEIINLIQIHLQFHSTSIKRKPDSPSKIGFLIGAVAAYTASGERDYDFTNLLEVKLEDQAPDVYVISGGVNGFSREWIDYYDTLKDMFPAGYVTPANVQDCLEFINIFGQWGLLDEIAIIDERVETPVDFVWYNAKTGNNIQVPAEPSPTLYGIGPFHGIYFLKLKPTIENGAQTPIAAISIVDRREIGDVRKGLSVPERRKGKFVTWIPAEGRFFKNVCPGPYDDVGYLALASFLTEIRKGKMTGSMAYDKFMKMRSELLAQKISITIIRCPEWDSYSSLTRRILNERRSRLERAPTVSVGNLQNIWLNLMTTATCYGCRSGNIEPLVRMQINCPELMTLNRPLALGDVEDWNLITGRSLGHLLSLWAGKNRIKLSMQRDVVVIGITDTGELHIPDHIRKLESVIVGVDKAGKISIPRDQFGVPLPEGPPVPLLPFSSIALDSISKLRALIDSFVNHKLE